MKRFLALLAGLALVLVCSQSFGEPPRGVVYDFNASWCHPCQQMAPVVEKLAREGLPLVKVDIDQERELASQFHIEKIPTFVVVVDGREVDRSSGMMSEADLRRMAARIPTSRPALAGPVISSPDVHMTIPVELGEAGPPPQPVRAPAMGPVEIRTVSAEPKRGLFDRLPFGRKTPEEPEVVRGSDASVGQDPALQLASHSQDGPLDPMQTSVRIRVVTKTNGRIDLGSGTVVSSRTGVTRILTCAHIFRELSDDSRILVDLFDRGRTVETAARLVKADPTSDLGLIEIPTAFPVPATKVGSTEAVPRVGDPLAAIGCSGGAEPTRQQLRVTDIDKYDGPHNILCTGVPVRGRSGGGLFNARGEIVGVCSAADEEEQRGFYSGLLAIHQLLDECSLRDLYMPASKPSSVAQPVVLASTGETPPTASAMTASPARTTATGSDPMDVSAGDAEVIVIIRDKSQSQEAHRVVIIHKASPKFISYLSGELPGGSLDSRLLGASAAELPALPAIHRTLRPSSPVQRAVQLAVHETIPPLPAKDLLRPTMLSQSIAPQQYVRSAESRLTAVR